jgi:hypothetical protein
MQRPERDRSVAAASNAGEDGGADKRRQSCLRGSGGPFNLGTVDIPLGHRRDGHSASESMFIALNGAGPYSAASARREAE